MHASTPLHSHQNRLKVALGCSAAPEEFFSPPRFSCASALAVPNVCGCVCLTLARTGHILQIVPGVYTGGMDHALRLVKLKNDRYRSENFKFFTGYAGWGPGQLQRECSEDVWWPVAASNALSLKSAVHLSKPLWSEVLELIGGDFTEIAKQGIKEP